MEIKDIIKGKRIEKGYSTSELAKLVGVNQSTIVRWEAGNIATMKQSKVMALANALGVSPAELIGDAEPKLTDAEKHIIDNYRKLSEDYKKQVELQIFLLLQMQNSADKEKESNVSA